MNILKNYASTILLLFGILAGGILGMVFGEDAVVVKPIGDIFLNFMYVLVVPIVCLSVSSAMCQMTRSNMIGKVLVNTLLIFVVMSVVAAVLSYLCILIYNPMAMVDSSSVFLEGAVVADNSMSPGEMFVNTLTVPEFLQLFEKPHLLPLIIFSVIFGFAVAGCGEKGEFIAHLLSSGTSVVLKMMDYLMYVAPLCLGCYFAATIGSMGSQIVSGFMGSFVLFLVLTLIFFFPVNTIYVFISGGKNAVKSFWKNMLTPSLTAIATSSSAACISVNIDACKKMGVSDNIASSVIPFGTNIHKDGSVISAIIKVVFLLTIFGGQSGFEMNGLTVILTALVSSMVVGAIPSGGMTGELLICSILGFSPELAGALLVISTIVDVPATLLNSTGNIVASVMVDSFSKKQNTDQ